MNQVAGFGWLWWGSDNFFSVNVDVGYIFGSQAVSYTISGDEYDGTGQVHDVTGSLDIQEALPDLVITDVAYTNSAEIGLYEVVTITIENQGLGHAEDFVTEIFYSCDNAPNIGEYGDDEITIWSLDAGSSIEIEFWITEWDPVIWKMWIIVDNECEVDEENENNNISGENSFFWYAPPINDSYEWPFYSYYNAHDINSVLNEYRSNHFHAGIDIDAPENTDVYSVSSGMIEEITFGLRIGNFSYRHINDYDDINVGNQGDWVVENHVQIAETDDNDHLHFEDGLVGNEINPLRIDGLIPGYNDYYSPEIGTLTINTAGTSNELYLDDPISGEVVLVVQAKDFIWNTNLRNGIMKIGYKIGNITHWSFDFSSQKIQSNYLDKVYPQAPDPFDGPDKWIYYTVTNKLESDNTVSESFLDLNSQEITPGEQQLTIMVEDFNGQYVETSFTVTVTPSAIDYSQDNKIKGE